MSDNKYKRGKIYRIVCNTTGLQYYGSTCEKYLSYRLAKHNYDYKKRNGILTSSKVLENGNYEILLVELFPCNSKDELHQRERFYIENNECVNKFIPLRTKQEYYKDNREHIIEKVKNYYENNKEDIAEKAKINYEKNKEDILEYHKNYNILNKQKISENGKIFRETNKDILKMKKHEYYEKTKEQKKAYDKIYCEANKEKIKEQKKLNYEQNKEKIKEYANK